MWKSLKTNLPGNKIKTVPTYPRPVSDFNNFFGIFGNEQAKIITQQSCNIHTHGYDFKLIYIPVEDTNKSLKSLPNTYTLDHR